MLEVEKIGRSVIHEHFMEEAGIRRLDPEDLSGDVPGGIKGFSFQFAGEHCTECAAPDCHDSCDLFEQGPTGRCRRFEAGLVSRSCKKNPLRYYLEFIAKPWAQIICVGNTLCTARVKYRFFSKLFLFSGRVSYAIQSLFRFMSPQSQWRLTDKLRAFGNRFPRLLNCLSWCGHGYYPDTLLCVLGNPHKEALTIEFAVSGFGDSQQGRVFRQSEIASEGWNVFKIPVADILQVINLKKLFRISMVPLVSNPRMLQLLYLGFISRNGIPMNTALERETVADEKAGKKVKLVVFDLDNTLWDGIIIENPDGNFPLREGTKELLEELDKRGILLSLASKNNQADAERILKDHGIWDLFLHPAINWKPKSHNIKDIVTNLNIGMDTVAFVDDSEFEREEVKTSLPEIRVFDALDTVSLLDMPIFNVSVSAESRMRRHVYAEESSRQNAFESVKDDYDTFLRSCEMKLELIPLNESNSDRVHELVQRTNQLNFSGNRYSRGALDTMLSDSSVIPVVMSCRDKFGNYGIVGFAILKIHEADVEVSDMMFSCRIQGKKIEDAFLVHLLGVFAHASIHKCFCRFNETSRNVHAAVVFGDLGFKKVSEESIQKGYVLECGKIDVSVPVTVVDELDLERIMNRR